MDSAHELKQALLEFFGSATSFVIVFMGNRLRRDDGVGIMIGEALLEKAPMFSSKMFIVHNSPANYLGRIIRKKPSHILFVDGVELQVKPGMIVLAPVSKLPPTSSITTHYQNFKELIRFMEMELGQKPRSLLLGVQVGSIEQGEGLTPVVREKTEKIVHVLTEVLMELDKKNIMSKQNTVL